MHNSSYVPREQWPEYDVASNFEPEVKPVRTGIKPFGVRWGLWPLFLEQYVGDQEPALNEPSAPPRLLVWRRTHPSPKPAGWIALGRKVSRREGYVPLGQGSFESRWSESARRERRAWHQQHLGTTHTIEKVGFDEFKSAYLASAVGIRLGEYHLRMVARRLKGPHADAVELWAARGRTGALTAGIAVVSSDTCKASYYLCGFHSNDGVPAMIGLMDHWLSWAQERGHAYADLGEFWIPGAPREWKGFSLFKSKLGPEYVDYPPALIRFVWGKIF